MEQLFFFVLDDVENFMRACMGTLGAVDARPNHAWGTDDHVTNELLD